MESLIQLSDYVLYTSQFKKIALMTGFVVQGHICEEPYDLSPLAF